VSGSGERGALAIVLHTHMPYVEGFGTWPFGEEWLWEAMAGCYLPLLDLLDEGAPLTLSLTPVLCDQLEVPGVEERFAAFVQGVRRETHAEDAAGLRAGGHEELARELERSWGEYAQALERLRERDGLLAAFARHAQWTSSATHAILPLLATDAGVRLQVQGGIASHRRRFGEHTLKGTGWRGGFWLPECAYAPWLGRALEEAGVRAACVELTNRFGLNAREHLCPLATEEGVLLVPIDRATMSLVWDDHGYPAAGAYRDYHHHTIHHHNPWSNDGRAYDHVAAQVLAREHAADFVVRTLERLREANESAPRDLPLAGGGLVVCALDTELLGHWWYEGITWLRAVVDECARHGLELVRLDDALARGEWPAVSDGRAMAPAPGLRVGSDESASAPAITWGKDGDLSTWSGPAVAEMAFASRAVELEAVAAGERVGSAAVRELLALQASDWPFMISREIAAPYAHERFEGHRLALEEALSAGTDADSAGLRNLAAGADPSLLCSP
jgi:1,4-alpha-glucan branching enzyme